MDTRVPTFLIFFVASVAFSEDFKTVNGKEYKDATVTRVEPDGIVLRTKSGISKVYFPELPKDVQHRFNYDPEKAAAYSAQQAADYAAVQKQQDEVLRQREEASQKANQIQAEQQSRQNDIQALQARHAALQQEENNLLLQIGEAKRPGPTRYNRNGYPTKSHEPNPLASQLPLLNSHLSDVRREKSEVRKQLEKAQR
ncbi:MAG: hypothetical protein DME33_02810 [Verrucomicrobia bacterium]|nr:MAG: hypothetical protein DME33_02810 [Verrucomicrobiota bacterium]